MSDAGHPAGIATRSVTPGVIATVSYGDGTSTDHWGPTEAVALDRATEGHS